MILGIDPGLTGAISVIEDGELIAIIDMPVTEKQHGKGKGVNAYLLKDLLSDVCFKDATAYLEAVSAMPGQGVTSQFGFGRSVGVVEGILAGMGIGVRLVTPHAWKRHWGLLKKDKDAARTLAISLDPEEAHRFARKKDIGRADATLIGLYGESIR